MSLYAASSGISKSNIYAHHHHGNNNITPMSITTTSSSPPPHRGGYHHYHHQHHQQHNVDNTTKQQQQQWQHLYILPVLLLEFLSIALTRAVLPGLLLERFDTNVYLVMGFAECIRGILAFLSCPLFGKLSDSIGRKVCLLVTVAGTCAPVCSLALLPWETTTTTTMMDESSEMSTTTNDGVDEMILLHQLTNSTIINATIAGGSEPEETPWPSSAFLSSSNSSSNYYSTKLHPQAITIFVILFSLSGILSSTFTLVFAYISDTVTKREERVSAYGLALATFGLSFTIGPIAGGYLAQYNTRYVFVCSLVFAILDILYIYAILPESRIRTTTTTTTMNNKNKKRILSSSSNTSVMSLVSLGEHKVSWNPWDTLRIIAIDPFLRLVGQVAFLYYTALWAVISTLTLFAAKRFDLGPERLGELMSALGLSTMVAEAVLVRIIVPLLGEKRSMRLGLSAFCFQCIFLGFAYEGWHLFVCILFSILGHLVYPSLSSLVSSSVEPSAVGEALGAVNGIKALTEGIGPLLFGSLMTLSEKSALPGWPYLLAAVIVYIAYIMAGQLPSDDDYYYGTNNNGVDDYIHELERKQRRNRNTGGTEMVTTTTTSRTAASTSFMGRFISAGAAATTSNHQDYISDDSLDEEEEEEYRDLIGIVREEDVSMLSEIEDTEDERVVVASSAGAEEEEDLSRLPLTFGSFFNKKTTSGASGLFHHHP